jgi:biopolymer transport protein ExbD
MTPMIDVIFLLLVFFVCTSSFQIIEHMLPSTLSSTIGSEPTPVEQPPEQADFDQVVIRLSWQTDHVVYTINGTPIDSFAEIRRYLRDLASIKQDAPLILHPDPQVPLGPVIETYDESKLAGFEKVSFAVNPQGVSQ